MEDVCNKYTQKELVSSVDATYYLKIRRIHSCMIKKPFSGITVINHREIKILLFNVYVTVGKQKPPGGILLGDFCFPIIFNLPISQIFCQIVVG